MNCEFSWTFIICSHKSDVTQSTPVNSMRRGLAISIIHNSRPDPNGTGDRGSYQRYIYRVTGNDGKIEVVIMVEGGENKEPYIKEIIAR